MNKLKKGMQVIAITAKAKNEVRGKIVALHETMKGVWVEVKPNGDGKNFRTRKSLVKPA